MLITPERIRESKLKKIFLSKILSLTNLTAGLCVGCRGRGYNATMLDAKIMGCYKLAVSNFVPIEHEGGFVLQSSLFKCYVRVVVGGI